MDSKETRAFAQQLMKEVWEPFDSEAASRFFHRDVVGWHRRADSSWQQLGYDDVVNRLRWDKQTNANPIFDVRDLIAEEDRFALRFLYAADFVPTSGKIDVETYAAMKSLHERQTKAPRRHFLRDRLKTLHKSKLNG